MPSYDVKTRDIFKAPVELPRGCNISHWRPIAHYPINTAIVSILVSHWPIANDTYPVAGALCDCYLLLTILTRLVDPSYAIPFPRAQGQLRVLRVRSAVTIIVMLEELSGCVRTTGNE